ncbi:MAG: HD domain-containing protein [Clostridium sp.]
MYDIRIDIPEDVGKIITILNDKGYEAYIVGGCVRDSILKKSPKDWDITTSALPDNVMDIFKILNYKVIPTGVKHGTVTVMINGEGYEITTYRIDGEYEKNRRPKEVEFTSSLRRDLERRDFTINAMAYNNEDGLIDYFGGIDDLKSKVIRAVGNPDKRFQEDALRMMRAVRFMAQLEFFVEELTFKSIKNLSYNIENISIERIRDEFNKLLIYDAFHIKTLIELGLLKYFINELVVCGYFNKNNSNDIFDVLTHCCKSANAIKKQGHKSTPLYLILTMLFHDIGKVRCKIKSEEGVDCSCNHELISKDISREILSRMKYDNKTIEKVTTLIQWHEYPLVPDCKYIKKMLNKIGEEKLRDLIRVKRADIYAEDPRYCKEKYKDLNITLEILEDIIKNNECYAIKDLKIKGSDLIEAGVVKGKDIGIILNALLEKVIEEQSLNDKSTLISIVKQEFI